MWCAFTSVPHLCFSGSTVCLSLFALVSQSYLRTAQHFKCGTAFFRLALSSCLSARRSLALSSSHCYRTCQQFHLCCARHSLPLFIAIVLLCQRRPFDQAPQLLFALERSATYSCVNRNAQSLPASLLSSPTSVRVVEASTPLSLPFDLVQNDPSRQFVPSSTPLASRSANNHSLALPQARTDSVVSR